MANGWLTTSMCAAAALLACAPAATFDPPPAGTEVAPRESIIIEVEHNRTDIGTLTVYLDDGVGPRRLLGSVAQGRVESFTIAGPLPARTLQLVGEAPLRRGVTSRPFNLAGRDGLRWVLSPNRIQPLGPRDVESAGGTATGAAAGDRRR
jgi:hypothetical protein